MTYIQTMHYTLTLLDWKEYSKKIGGNTGSYWSVPEYDVGTFIFTGG
ncbi:hypothetical protein AIOGIFDO_00846 [Candidatus Methanoperedenaceae archaeon GB37]|nr:hypothetical protein AIOGIFDO_00846 [Candidatus Methanoperedenaceae archaeon GB37]